VTPKQGETVEVLVVLFPFVVVTFLVVVTFCVVVVRVDMVDMVSVA
jgi:hypothetical protein